MYPVLLWRGWGRWNDVQVDFGRELYVPWRLAEGDVLYRDIAYFNGPLSPYWNAMWFSVAGDSLQTLMVVNALLTGLFAILLHRVVASLSGPVAAGASLLFFFPMFACGHFPGTGNYNFMTPYSHEITHGLFLGLGAFALALAGRRAGQAIKAALAGLLLGLCFLTKAEVFIACLGAVVWLFALSWKTERTGYWVRAALLAGCSLIAPVAAFLLLMGSLDATQAAVGVLGSWTGIFGSNATSSMFYGDLTGLRDLGFNLGQMAENFGWLSMLFLPAIGLERFTASKSNSLRWGLGIVYAAAVGTALATTGWNPGGWMWSARSLPLIALLAVVLCAVLAWRGRVEARGLWIARSGFAMLAFLMFLKIMFNVMLAHYGFVLALCGSMLWLSILIGWLPGSRALKAGPGIILRCAAFAWLVGTAAAFWSMTEESFATKNMAVGEGPDQFYACANNGADFRGEGVRQLLVKVDEWTGPTQTLLVLPEGIMVNYLARRKTPTRHINFMPPELELFGERNILQDLRDAPNPAACVLMHKNTSEYGFPYFGTDYGLLIMKWVGRRYKPDWQFAQPPLQPSTGNGFGIGFLGPR